MPANRHLFTETPLPQYIVADSSFIFHALIDDLRTGFHVPARDFAEALRNANSILLYSSLVFLEAPQCWRRLYNKEALVPRQRGMDQLTDRINAFNEANADLLGFLARFRKYEVRITKARMRAANAVVARYGFISSHDALAVAIAHELGITDLAALDADFKNVNGIELWDGFLT
jgi:predicted nucleic acid-binding protein